MRNSFGVNRENLEKAAYSLGKQSRRGLVVLSSAFKSCAKHAPELVRHIQSARQHRLQIEDYEKQYRSAHGVKQKNLTASFLVASGKMLGGTLNSLLVQPVKYVGIGGLIAAGVHVGNGNDPMDIPGNVMQWEDKHQIIEVLTGTFKPAISHERFFIPEKGAGFKTGKESDFKAYDKGESYSKSDGQSHSDNKRDLPPKVDNYEYRTWNNE